MRRELLPFNNSESRFPFLPLSNLGSSLLSELQPFTQHMGVDFSEEEDGSYVIKLPLAGFAKENITVTYDKDTETLAVVADIKETNRTAHKEYSYRMRNLDPDNIKANHHEGMLELKIRRTETDSPESKIEIPVG